MRRVMLIASLLLLAATPVAAGAGTPRLTSADRAEIGTLVDRFVKDAVRRENLPAAWLLAGPDLRGGTTRAAWDAGTGVTVQFFPARGADFRNAWTVSLVGPGRAVLALMLFPDAAHPRLDQIAMTVGVRKRGGHWVVDNIYQAASFGKDGTVTGPRDFGAAGAGPVYKPQASAVSWLYGVTASVAGVLVLTPLLLFLRVKRRDRRARLAYEAVVRRRI
jgi:hypothetical protein